MAQLICTFKEFNDCIGPKIRNDVATITKQKNSKLKSICESCKNKSELDTVHKHGRSRKNIIRIVLNECETEDDRYIIQDLQNTIKAIKEQHFPIEDNFRFLCRPCHIQYDSQAKQTEIANIQKTELINNYHTQDYNNEYQKEFELLLSQNLNLRECLKKLFLRFPDTIISSTELRRVYGKHYPNATRTQTQKITNYLWELTNYENFLESPSRSLYKLAYSNNESAKNTYKATQKNQKKSQTNIDGNGVKEILCENEINSWRYKIGWTSIKNRMNILELIAMIEFTFDCYPIAFKSWYYHNRKDTRKQFSGIICHKQRSEICFRIDPNSFSIKDSQIIHGKRWFFSEGKEKRIKIIPENYDLIMKCLKYSYDIC